MFDLHMRSTAYSFKGVARTCERISDKQKLALNQWIEENADRYWLNKGGPLRPPSEGGADIIVVTVFLAVYVYIGFLAN